MKSWWAWIKEHKITTGAVMAIAVVAIGLGQRTLQLRNENVTEPIGRGPIIESVYGIGTVMATRSFQLKWGVASTVRALYVKEGDSVKRGQRLVDLDGVQFTAPFDGTVTALPFIVGETVFAQTTILSVVDLRDRYMVVSMEQRGALRVRRGQRARISVDSMRGETYDGVVQSVYSNDNNFLVRIDVSMLPPQILPGMTADVAIGIAERQNALLVPVVAIDQGRVYVKRGARTRPIDVKIGAVDGTMAEVLAGDVHEGDRLLIRHSKP